MAKQQSKCNHDPSPPACRIKNEDHIWSPNFVIRYQQVGSTFVFVDNMHHNVLPVVELLTARPTDQ